MTTTDVAISDLFRLVGGDAKFIRDYMDKRGGPHPVYSASLAQPFGYVDEFDYEGTYLSWVMNGYGGRVQELSGRFSINRDRGVLIPREPEKLPDLTFLRYVMEPQLVAAAVGRRVDGRQNEYTKIYSEAAAGVFISLPLDSAGQLDYPLMARLGEKLRKLELAQKDVRSTREALERAEFAVEVADPCLTISLDDAAFDLSIGKRVLVSEHSDAGVPVYSANVIVPFGKVAASNLENFDRPSLLWGIDGNFDWNFIPAGLPFATTDHCGRLQVLRDDLLPEYVFWYLKLTRARYGFDRTFRSSLGNMKAEVSVQVPLDSSTGQPSLSCQRAFAEGFKSREASRTLSLRALEDVLSSRISVEAWMSDQPI